MLVSDGKQYRWYPLTHGESPLNAGRVVQWGEQLVMGVTSHVWKFIPSYCKNPEREREHRVITDRKAPTGGPIRAALLSPSQRVVMILAVWRRAENALNQKLSGNWKRVGNVSSILNLLASCGGYGGCNVRFSQPCANLSVSVAQRRGIPED
jgi:hypothetical protein